MATRKRTTTRRRRSAPRRATTARRRYRRNPVKLSLVNSMVKPAAIGAAGAIGLDLAYAYLPIPEGIKAGPFKYVAKGGAAIAMAMIAEKIMSKSTARELGRGALTVVFHEAARDALASHAPGLALDAYMTDEMAAYTDYEALSYAGSGEVIGDLEEIPGMENVSTGPVAI